jgi:hypothetical protein
MTVSLLGDGIYVVAGGMCLVLLCGAGEAFFGPAFGAPGPGR